MERETLEMVMSMVKQTLLKESVTFTMEEGDSEKAVPEINFDDVAIQIANFISVTAKGFVSGRYFNHKLLLWN